MADTGELSPTTQTGFLSLGPNAIDGNDATSAYMLGFGATDTATVGSVAGTDIPEGATINGVKVIIRGQYSPLFSYEETDLAYVKLSLDGGSNYSSNIGAQTLQLSATDHNFGGAKNTSSGIQNTYFGRNVFSRSYYSEIIAKQLWLEIFS